MNFLDRGIEIVAPRMALARAEARARLEMVRAYDAAGHGRRTQGWRRTPASQNTENAVSLPTLRYGARELVRNNAYAAKAVRSVAGHTVGKGIRPRPVSESERIRRRANYYWDSFVDSCDVEGRATFYGIQKLVMRTVVESGEALVLYIPRPATFGLKIPMQVRVLEPDHLDDTKWGPTPGGGVIVQGVEFDASGRRVAYWIRHDHPGDTISWTYEAGSVRVPAQFVDHVFETLRPGQARGVTWFAPVALKLRDHADYAEAVAVKKKIEACFVAFVTRPNTGPQSPGVTGAAETGADGKRGETVSPGMIKHLSEGEDVEFGQPSSSSGEVDYMVHTLHEIATGIGMTYMQMTGDVRQANYSSMRSGTLDFYGLVDGWQHDMIIPQLCRSAWRRCAMLAAARESLPSDLRAEHSVPVRPWVDPLKDIKAARDSVRAGIETMPDLIAQRGTDPDEHIREMKSWKDRLDEAGLVLDSDPRRVTQGGAAHKNDPLDEEPDEDDAEDPASDERDAA